MVPFFAKFIGESFNLCFGKAGPKVDGKRIFVMDNDPSQTSKMAMSALRNIECELHEIPPRSPDLNPIENTFHLVKKRLKDEAIRLRITEESFEHFKQRLLNCLDSLDVPTIDRTILSMPKRVKGILTEKGRRLIY